MSGPPGRFSPCFSIIPVNKPKISCHKSLCAACRLWDFRVSDAERGSGHTDMVFERLSGNTSRTLHLYPP